MEISATGGNVENAVQYRRSERDSGGRDGSGTLEGSRGAQIEHFDARSGYEKHFFVRRIDADTARCEGARIRNARPTGRAIYPGTFASGPSISKIARVPAFGSASYSIVYCRGVTRQPSGTVPGLNVTGGRVPGGSGNGFRIAGKGARTGFARTRTRVPDVVRVADIGRVRFGTGCGRRSVVTREVLPVRSAAIRYRDHGSSGESRGVVKSGNRVGMSIYGLRRSRAIRGGFERCGARRGSRARTNPRNGRPRCRKGGGRGVGRKSGKAKRIRSVRRRPIGVGLIGRSAKFGADEIACSGTGIPYVSGIAFISAFGSASHGVVRGRGVGRRPGGTVPGLNVTGRRVPDGSGSGFWRALERTRTGDALAAQPGNVGRKDCRTVRRYRAGMVRECR